MHTHPIPRPPKLSSRADVCALCRPQSKDRGNPQVVKVQRSGPSPLSSRAEWPVFSFAPLFGAPATQRRDLLFSSLLSRMAPLANFPDSRCTLFPGATSNGYHD
jgi:hypothetical protein